MTQSGPDHTACYDTLSDGKGVVSAFADHILNLAPIRANIRGPERVPAPRKWYHGTCGKALPGILKHGIQPRPVEGVGNYPAMPSASGMTYLTLGFAPYYARNTAEDDDSPVILEIDAACLNWTLVYPDEDFLRQVKGFAVSVERFLENALPDDPGQPGMRAAYGQHVALYKADAARVTQMGEPVDHQPFWQASMEGLGNVAYSGCIPVAAITRVVVQEELSGSLAWAIVAGGAVNMNYYHGRAHALNLLTAHLFDGTTLFPEWDDPAYLERLPRETLAEIQGIKKEMRRQYLKRTKVYLLHRR